MFQEQTNFKIYINQLYEKTRDYRHKCLCPNPYFDFNPNFNIHLMKNALLNNFREVKSPFMKTTGDFKPNHSYEHIPKEKLYLMLWRFGIELEQSVPFLEERTNFIILFQRVDFEEIEKVLDKLLDCITWEMGIDTFKRLINYYHNINPLGAINYQSEFNKIQRFQIN
jgi:hypothetical protein